VDRPTEFPELNDVLRDLVASAREILGDSMAGAYLQGSFALGDADIDSDCDFLIPLERPVSAQQEHDLRGLHSDIPIRPGHWTRHLEGSYPPIGRLATLDGLGESWLYIDHGWREMQWSTHCNTEVVRWTLREHGVTLAGPDPRTFMVEISPDLLRSRMRRDVTTYLTDLEGWIAPQNRTFVARLISEGIPATVDAYGPGSHDWPYWERALHRALPMLLKALGAKELFADCLFVGPRRSRCQLWQQS